MTKIKCWWHKKQPKKKVKSKIIIIKTNLGNVLNQTIILQMLCVSQRNFSILCNVNNLFYMY